MSDKDPAYLAWVRGLECVSCGHHPPSEPHHHTHGRGMGQKRPDREAMPLCSKCHREFHDGKGKSAGLSKEGRRALQDTWLWLTQQRRGNEEAF